MFYRIERGTSFFDRDPIGDNSVNRPSTEYCTCEDEAIFCSSTELRDRDNLLGSPAETGAPGTKKAINTTVTGVQPPGASVDPIIKIFANISMLDQ